MKDTLRVGVAGLGTVGTALVRLLAERRDGIATACGRPIDIVAVSARDRARRRGVDLSAAVWEDDPVRLAQRGDIDVFVELIGGEDDPARAAVEAALARGRHVVTANKALVASHGVALARQAEANGAALLFEAAVAGGIPAIRTVRDALAGDRITAVEGILNGTCNYILTRMEREGLDFASCLAEAQRLGYAEADPTFDVDGFDTAHKIAILASLAFGTEMVTEPVHVEGIRSIAPQDLKAAAELGYRIKLLGIARLTENGVDQRVHPTMVPLSSEIAQVSGVANAVAVRGAAVGTLTLVGPGAGGPATASAVLGDLADIARGTAPPPFGRAVAALVPYRAADLSGHRGGFYIRLSVTDEAGAFARIAGHMAREGISLKSIVQRQANQSDMTASGGADDTVQPVILITHPASEAALARALAAVADDQVTAAAPQVIRIDDDEA